MGVQGSMGALVPASTADRGGVGQWVVLWLPWQGAQVVRERPGRGLELGRALASSPQLHVKPFVLFFFYLQFPETEQNNDFFTLTRLRKKRQWNSAKREKGRLPASTAGSRPSTERAGRRHHTLDI